MIRAYHFSPLLEHLVTRIRDRSQLRPTVVNRRSIHQPRQAALEMPEACTEQPSFTTCENSESRERQLNGLSSSRIRISKSSRVSCRAPHEIRLSCWRTLQDRSARFSQTRFVALRLQFLFGSPGSGVGHVHVPELQEIEHEICHRSGTGSEH